MRVLVRVAVALLGAVLVFVGVTAWALEWSGVAVVETRQPDGGVRETRVWYVHDEEGRLLLEAGAQASPWLADVRARPELVFVRDDRRETRHARIRPNPEGHLDIRRRLREKYGLRDAWIGLVFDLSETVQVELAASAEGGG